MDLQRLDGVVLDQFVAALRHHHRIQHDARNPVFLQFARHRLDQFRRIQHADLDRVRAEIGEHRVELPRHEVDRHRMDAGHALRILRGQRRDHAHSIAAVGRKRLQVGLDARPAPAVRARDGQRAPIGFLVHGPPPAPSSHL